MRKIFFVAKKVIILAIVTIITLLPNSTFSAFSENCSFLDTAKLCHDYIRTNDFYYSRGATIPLDSNLSKRVDCSSFVSWVLYTYTDGQFSTSKDSSWFLRVAKALAKGKTPDMPEITSNWQVISSLSDLMPGDIMCYSGHVMVFAGYNSDGKPLAYNAGEDKFIKQDTSIITKKRFKQMQYGLRIS